jgi:hypothetical protein
VSEFSAAEQGWRSTPAAAGAGMAGSACRMRDQLPPGALFQPWEL